MSKARTKNNIVKNIFQNKIKHIIKKANLLRNTLTHVKKRKKEII